MQAGSDTEVRPTDRSDHPLPQQADLQQPRLLRLGQAIVLVVALVAVIVIADQSSKAWITPRFGPCGNPHFTPVIGLNVGISYVCNTGTAFSRFQNTGFVWLPVLLAVGIVGWLWSGSLSAPQLLQQAAFGLIIGGALGNIIDRARLGYVVDFVDLRLNDQWRFYVFNVADSSICVGVALLAVAYWRIEAARSRDGAAAQTT